MKKSNQILTGVSGEYFVAAELSRRGYIASITLRNTKGVDILCSDDNAIKTVGIQVKSNSHSRRGWLLNEKAENYYADNLFYVFVNLHDQERQPDFFIVPSRIVAKDVKSDHEKWIKTPGKYGKMHNATSMRMWGDEKEKYLSRWDLLGL
jgi:hypothetical protein